MHKFTILVIGGSFCNEIHRKYYSSNENEPPLNLHLTWGILKIYITTRHQVEFLFRISRKLARISENRPGWYTGGSGFVKTGLCKKKVKQRVLNNLLRIIYTH